MRHLPRNALLGHGVSPLKADDRKSRAQPTSRPCNALEVLSGLVSYEVGPITTYPPMGSRLARLQEDIAEITGWYGSHPHELFMKLFG